MLPKHRYYTGPYQVCKAKADKNHLFSEEAGFLFYKPVLHQYTLPASLICVPIEASAQ